MDHPDRFDVIVIGGGHAGTEAALAAARMGARTLLLTQSLETIGQMSCNPAIGGIGKSHLVREIDALGGAMARAADRAGIHFRTLNASKGPAVRATRAQADRNLYRAAIRQIVDDQPGLSVFQQAVTDLTVVEGRVTGVCTQMGVRFLAQAVVLTTGTFLGGIIHIGFETAQGGRAGDAPANALAERLRSMPFRVARLKTGTPPRLDGGSIDLDELEAQPGDEPRPVMSFLGTPAEHPAQRSCYITQTNPQTHDIIRAALDRSPLYQGAISGIGPRYCPSIEDKVVRFADRPRHQVFVEPEGLTTTELYPNGISTSLPFDVQLAFVRSIRGFERAHVTRPGYAIEYDFFDPRGLERSLMTRACDGLYFAGQINGTTGYEEAAAQGLLAGINAALQVQGRRAWTPGRDEAYLGVMIDDLITNGADEPYRMFTSRAEFRLRLREDNADARLTPKGRELGLVDDVRWHAFRSRRRAVDTLVAELARVTVRPGSDMAGRLQAATGEMVNRETSLLDVLKRPSVPGTVLATLGGPRAAAPVWAQAEIEVKYEGYIRRQDEEIARVKRHERFALPADLDFAHIDGLSNELREKLARLRPGTLAAAGRIPGMTPAALSLLLVHARALERAGGGARSSGTGGAA